MKNKNRNLIIVIFIFIGLIVSTNYISAATITKTLYSWVKDAAGNISTSLSDSVAITLPDLNTYYISPSGNDTTGDGSISSPWMSLSKACNSVITPGSTIHVKAGTYIEPSYCDLAVGVSIEGEGTTNTIIKGTYVIPNYVDRTTATIRLYSSVAGTNGNQSISNLTLDGNGLQGSRAVAVYNRGNVKIHHSVIKDFYMGGVIFSNSYTYSTSLSAILEENNEIYNNTIDNCGDGDAEPDYKGGGLIAITTQKDMLIHDNLLYSNKRVDAHNGNIINAGGTRFRGVKYYNNQSWKPDMTNDYGSSGLYSWNFHLEFWGNDGGFEIYNNTFTGGSIAIDVAGYGYTENTGGYPYSWSIHDNVFQQNDPSFFSYGGMGILLESRYLTKTLIYNNSFNHYYRGISIIGNNVHDVYMYDNIFTKIEIPLSISYGIQGTQFLGIKEIDNINFYKNTINVNTGVGYGIPGVINIDINNGWTASNFNFLNNTIVTDNIIYSGGIKLVVQAGLTMTNFNIKNNIFGYFRYNGPFIIENNGTINGLNIENNLSYNLSNANILPIFSGNTINNYTYLNNIPTSNTTQQNPLFVSSSDFHLQSTSPAINKGIDVGLPYNGSSPDIGVFETNS